MNYYDRVNNKILNFNRIALKKFKSFPVEVIIFIFHIFIALNKCFKILYFIVFFNIYQFSHDLRTLIFTSTSRSNLFSFTTLLIIILLLHGFYLSYLIQFQSFYFNFISMELKFWIFQVYHYFLSGQPESKLSWFYWKIVHCK